jgi:very-short-patch-repair endonuclease
MGKFILDFYAPELRLAIEIDGDSHAGERAGAYDRERTKYLAELGIYCIRFTNSDVMKNLDNVAENIRRSVLKIKNPS